MLAALRADFSGTGNGSFLTDFASGNVTGGANSVLGGFIGGLGAVSGDPNLILLSAASGTVTSTGPNSVLGGLVGINGGTIVGSSASGPVTGTTLSYLGGFRRHQCRPDRGFVHALDRIGDWHRCQQLRGRFCGGQLRLD